MSQANIPVDEYMVEAADFKPSEFDAEAYVQLAKDAGMKHIVITGKHCVCIRTVGGDFTSADVIAIRFTPVKI